MNSSSPSLTDSILQYEFSRSPIILKSYDTSTGEIILKSSFPAILVGQIFELGVFSYNNNPFSNGYDDKIIFNFDESWYNTSTASSASVSNSGRVGASNYLVYASTSANIYTTSTIDLSGYSSSDYIEFLYNVTTLQSGTRAASIVFTDSQYPTAGTAVLSMNINTASLGYQKYSDSYGSLVKTLNFNGKLSKINLILEGGSKTSVLQIDSAKIRDVALSDENFCLVSRALIGITSGSTSTDYFTKEYGAEMDIEYRMTIS